MQGNVFLGVFRLVWVHGRGTGGARASGVGTWVLGGGHFDGCGMEGFEVVVRCDGRVEWFSCG